MQLLIGTGLCTLSTCSDFSFETVRLGERDGARWAAANLAVSAAVSAAAGLAAAFAGVAPCRLL